MVQANAALVGARCEENKVWSFCQDGACWASQMLAL